MTSDKRAGCEIRGLSGDHWWLGPDGVAPLNERARQAQRQAEAQRAEYHAWRERVRQHLAALRRLAFSPEDEEMPDGQ